MWLQSLALFGTNLSQLIIAQDTFPPPTKFGIALFPGFQSIDAFGPLDILNVLAWRTQLNLTILAATLDPVSTSMNALPHNRSSSTFAEHIVPTHTFATAPLLEVLIVPGGLGNRLPAAIPTVDYIRTVYPSLRYLITVCTGSSLAARAGVLDGKRATTNKWAFYETAKLGPKTHWVAKARWVVDENVWSSSGVTAGMDVTLAWVASVWGYATAKEIADGAEYAWHEESEWDPFSEKWGVVDVVSGVGASATASSTASGSASGSVVLASSSRVVCETATATVTVTITSTKTTTSKTNKTTKSSNTQTSKTSKTVAATTNNSY